MSTGSKVRTCAHCQAKLRLPPASVIVRCVCGREFDARTIEGQSRPVPANVPPYSATPGDRVG